MATRAKLAKLSDAELTERLERAWARYDAADKWLQRWSSAGKIRYPRLRRFWKTLSGSSGFRVVDGILSMYLGRWPARPLLIADDAIVMNEEYCEIRDLTDELERRVARQNKTISP